MPELPEVETIRRDLHKHILNKKIVHVDNRSTYVTRYDTAEGFGAAVQGASIEAIDRIGKLLIFQFIESPNAVLCHLRMTGQLIYRTEDASLGGGHSLSKTKKILPHQHTRMIFTFEDGSKLFFNDSRQFGYFKLIQKEQLGEVYKKFGIEPLTKEYTFDNFVQALKGKQRSVKAVMLDQGVLAGFGNIYVDETCFAAGVLPDRLVTSLTEEEMKKLFEEGQRIIALAIEQRGTTFNNYVDGKGKKGNFVRLLHVYQRKGKPCFVCGATIQKITVAQRGTHFCLCCQV